MRNRLAFRFAGCVPIIPGMVNRAPYTGPAVWYGRDLVGSDEWIYQLSQSDIAEIDEAIEAVGHRQTPVGELVRDDFLLPTLGPALRGIQHEVVSGRGFVLLRNLPVARYTKREAITAYWGIGLHFGWPISQNAKGHLLGHVTNIGLDPSNPHHRIYATKVRHLFHTDSCDVVGLLCLQPAKEGGLSSVVSSVTIYNEMLAQRPDLVEVLEQPFVVDRKGEIPAGKRPYYEMPVFNHYAGHLTTIYARDFIEAAQRFEEVPRLRPEQVEAMDLLDALAARDDVRLNMTLAQGDIQLLHSHQTLHARTAFEDYAEPERRRHLLRLWLAPPNSRPLPPVFAERYGTIEVGTRRGGIMVPGAKLHVSFDPV